jgi:hypothetical protein
LREAGQDEFRRRGAAIRAAFARILVAVQAIHTGFDGDAIVGGVDGQVVGGVDQGHEDSRRVRPQRTQGARARPFPAGGARMTGSGRCRSAMGRDDEQVRGREHDVGRMAVREHGVDRLA